MRLCTPVIPPFLWLKRLEENVSLIMPSIALPATVPKALRTALRYADSKPGTNAYKQRLRATKTEPKMTSGLRPQRSLSRPQNGTKKRLMRDPAASRVARTHASLTGSFTM